MSDELGVLCSSSSPTKNDTNDGGSAEISSQFQMNETVAQTSPHNYRHSRAYRHFKNPPQPHMCIRTTTILGDELFINVLSWTRIVIPQEPSDPIPLYGGMRVPPGSPRCPPLVYAVMANPEVLKDSGRHSKDPEERRAMVELMCDFVEAMNPDVKLTRNAVILKDRDISGELKDVWNAVQAQRDREREEQISQQQRQQQQHYHNITTQQMFPKMNQQHSPQHLSSSPNNSTKTAGATSTISQEAQQITNKISQINSHEIETDNKISYMDIETATKETEASTVTVPTTLATTTMISSISKDIENTKLNDKQMNIQNTEIETQSAINSLANINFTFSDKDNDKNLTMTVSNNCLSDNSNNNSSSKSCNKNINSSSDDDVTDSTNSILISKNQTNNSILNINQTSNTAIINNVDNTITTTVIKNLNEIHQSNLNQQINISTANNFNSTTISTIAPTATTNITTSTTTSSSNTNITTATAIAVTTTTTTPQVALPTKKDKLGGFLPNGCIFPRFKNNKHKEKEKDKDKEKDNTKSSSNKEKTLLNSLKKVTSQSNKSNNQQQQENNKAQQFEKKCCSLENQVEKLDLNKLDSAGAKDMVIKVKVASSGAK